MKSASLKILLVDDEEGARINLSNLIQIHCSNTVVIQGAQSVQEATNLVDSFHPDIVFLDVQLQDGTGFDLLDRLPKINFNLVFTTAYDEYALKAFRYNAIDYLLKPICVDELIVSFNKASLQINRYDQELQINNLIKTTHEDKFDQIVLPTSDALIVVPVQKIRRLESFGNYTYVYLISGERHLVSRNLKEFEEMLPEALFFRSHQSHIVNTKCIKMYLKDENAISILQSGERIPIARRRKDALMEVLDK